MGEKERSQNDRFTCARCGGRSELAVDANIWHHLDPGEVVVKVEHYCSACWLIVRQEDRVDAISRVPTPKRRYIAWDDMNESTPRNLVVRRQEVTR